MVNHALLSAPGQFGYLLLRVAMLARHAFTDRRRIVAQLNDMGVNSLPVALMVGVFAGAIIAWQGGYQLKSIAPMSLLGGQVSRVIMMEMGPVLTALVMCGRIGASIAAEISSMKLSGQVDALRSMALDPLRFLVMPRVIGLTIALPLLTFIVILVALGGGALVASWFLDVHYSVFFESARDFFQYRDLWGGLAKAMVYGVIISSIGSYMGLHSRAGAEGLGRATISAFVTAAISVLAADFLLWIVLF